MKSFPVSVIVCFHALLDRPTKVNIKRVRQNNQGNRKKRTCTRINGSATPPCGTELFPCESRSLRDTRFRRPIICKGTTDHERMQFKKKLVVLSPSDNAFHLHKRTMFLVIQILAVKYRQVNFITSGQQVPETVTRVGKQPSSQCSL